MKIYFFVIVTLAEIDIKHPFPLMSNGERKGSVAWR